MMSMYDVLDAIEACSLLIGADSGRREMSPEEYDDR